MVPLYSSAACEDRKRALLAEIDAAIAAAEADIERFARMRRVGRGSGEGPAERSRSWR
jgi:hypothetical protein